MPHRHLDSEPWIDILKRRRAMMTAFWLIPLVDVLLLALAQHFHFPEALRRAVFLASLAAVLAPFVRFLEVACPGCRRALFRASLDLGPASGRCLECDAALGTPRFGGPDR